MMFIFLLGNVSGTLNPLPLATSPWHSKRVHFPFEKQDRNSQDSVAGGPEGHLLIQEHMWFEEVEPQTRHL